MGGKLNSIPEEVKVTADYYALSSVDSRDTCTAACMRLFSNTAIVVFFPELVCFSAGIFEDFAADSAKGLRRSNIQGLPAEGSIIAGSADRPVEFLTTNEFDLLLASQSLAKARVLSADSTDGVEFDHMLSKRDEFEYVSELFALKGSVKSSYDDDLSLFRQII